MTLLKDVRLLLIIGLAIVCLIALKMCSSTYETTATTGDDASTNAVAESANESGEAAKVVAEDLTGDAENTDTQATVEAVITEKSDEVAEVAEPVASEETTAAETITEEPATTEISTEQAAVEVQTAVASTDIQTTSIVLRDVATSGEFVPDLKTDIGSVQDGLTQYTEKLDDARTLLERLKGAMQ